MKKLTLFIIATFLVITCFTQENNTFLNSLKIENSDEKLIGIGGGDNEFIQLIYALIEVNNTINDYFYPKPKDEQDFIGNQNNYDKFIIDDDISITIEENIIDDKKDKTIKCVFKLDNKTYIFESEIKETKTETARKIMLLTQAGLIFSYRSTQSFANAMYEDLKVVEIYNSFCEKLENLGYSIYTYPEIKLTAISVNLQDEIDKRTGM